MHGKEHRIGLGSASAIPLKRARELAAEARRLRAEKIDPLQHRREQRSAKLVEQAARRHLQIEPVAVWVQTGRCPLHVQCFQFFACHCFPLDGREFLDLSLSAQLD